MLRLVIGVTLFLTLIGVVLYGMGWRLLGSPRGARGWRRTCWWVYGFYALLALFSVPVVRLLEPSLLREIFQWCGLTALGLTALLFGLVVVRELVLAVYGLWTFFSGPPLDEAALERAGSRRDFLRKSSAAVVVGATAGLTARGISNARETAALKEVTIPVAGLDPALDGLKVLQLSDIHVGDTIGRGYFQRVVDRAMSVGAELICVTGDLVDGTVDQLRHDIEPVDQLSAPLGVWFVTGNHEYYSGPIEWIEELKRRGVRVLEDSHAVLSRGGAPFVLAGIHDRSASTVVPEHASDPVKALEGAPATSLCILMAHQPISYEQVEGLPVDLQLSGHTHGGQIWPFGYLVPLQQRFIAGLHRVFGRTWLYISRGTGYWGPPMRVGSPSEITVITIRRG